MDLSETQLGTLFLWVMVMVILQTVAVLAISYAVVGEYFQNKCGADADNLDDQTRQIERQGR